jgi:hypothetical protein
LSISGSSSFVAAAGLFKELRRSDKTDRNSSPLAPPPFPFMTGRPFEEPDEPDAIIAPGAGGPVLPLPLLLLPPNDEFSGGNAPAWWARRSGLVDSVEADETDMAVPTRLSQLLASSGGGGQGVCSAAAPVAAGGASPVRAASCASRVSMRSCMAWTTDLAYGLLGEPSVQFALPLRV